MRMRNSELGMRTGGPVSALRSEIAELEEIRPILEQ